MTVIDFKKARTRQLKGKSVDANGMFVPVRKAKETTEADCFVYLNGGDGVVLLPISESLDNLKRCLAKFDFSDDMEIVEIDDMQGFMEMVPKELDGKPVKIILNPFPVVGAEKVVCGMLLDKV